MTREKEKDGGEGRQGHNEEGQRRLAGRFFAALRMTGGEGAKEEIMKPILRILFLPLHMEEH